MRFGRKKPNADFDASTIDAVAMMPDGEVRLILQRDEPWTGTDSELHSLPEKVQTYVAYAADGQMHRDYPETAGKPWVVYLTSPASVGEPDARTQFVIEHLQQALPNHGGGLRMGTQG